ncbi:hypothetical protein BU25DRAFT_451013 [Macroventuria anomochaeta]|uniref:Uncharacterized protein n=1 Tax=Macroventuria anomochaeta TaxID=301207 RepID=A0ACB6RQK6_9PLEO|nr:uncharacterized protein BU25DRAFT_451013 [Macroventuria anomochaeta]KAF2624093.1 hypothetical protein BU25DRAFT_451013 [Macroventuria anomochaeta]
MKVNNLTILSLLSLVSGSIAYSSRFRAQADNDPIQERQRVTAFVNTDEGLKVQCWELGDFLPSNNNAGGIMRATSLAGNLAITLYSFAPSVTLFSLDHRDGPQTNAVDFRAQPNLFTVKDGLIFVNAIPSSTARKSEGEEEEEIFIFADVNGDDWFYFEDDTTNGSAETCAKPQSENGKASASTFTARTISGSDTTLINFAYDSTPKHKVLHDGRCNFAGLTPISQSRREVDARRFRVQS